VKKLTKFILSAVAAALVGTFSAGLVTGCAAFENARTEARPAVLFVLKEAYACGGAAAVSNRIEQLVVDGKVTPAQAAQLHILARCAVEALLRRAAEGEARAEGAQAAAALFDRAVERLEAEDLEAALTPTNAPAVQ